MFGVMNNSILTPLYYLITYLNAKLEIETLGMVQSCILLRKNIVG
ncbi:hypothetical protein NMY3_01685 [Candidatus Nitrosocosmicus oleophilus]|uniref:Uncharacterized protein n=1 Tax=Candidatus Nitrosocosmicus oleophilus TaxID=1353260 RepID=A0A654LWQ7_9ARCH|nr:hypothetical protein NMY3_01685 [Candidatus Nitrosocosmicus oleophilus]